MTHSLTASLDGCLVWQVKLREMTILDLQKKIAEGDAKLKQQQNLYEPPRHPTARWDPDALC